ncbi:MAG: hypothetical protein EPO06_11605 [Burkholderiaceae bacterium]|nr:MAG: hypothetical protein EPO06_11605 [Burkholderiaceae bacterium]
MTTITTRADLSTLETTVHGTVIDGRDVGQYEPMGQGPGHSHSLYNVVGYAVRRTVADGVVLWRGEGPDAVCGYDTAAYAGSASYGLALADARRYRVTGNPGRSWAVVDMLYGCGCRGGR